MAHILQHLSSIKQVKETSVEIFQFLLQRIIAKLGQIPEGRMNLDYPGRTSAVNKNYVFKNDDCDTTELAIHSG